jgi:hypothetical protein
MIASGARYDQMVDFKTKSDKVEMLVHLNRVSVERSAIC